MMKGLLPLCICFLLLSTSVFGQDIKVVDILAKVVDEEGKVVEVYYTLVDSLGDESLYTVSLYGVFEGTKKLLYNVSGDVGDNVEIGNNKITWNAQDEFPRLRGEVYFEIRAIRSFDIIRPETGTIVKRGNEFTFEWFGENSDKDKLTLELYQNKVLIDTLAIIDNASSYTWEIPRRNPVGEGFQLKITGTELTDIDAFSREFAIKRKVPIGAQVGLLGAGLIGGLIAVLLQGEGEIPPPEPLPTQ